MNKMYKAALLCALLAVLFIAAWENYWRNRGFIPTYNDDKALWAEERSRAYLPADKATVFIGSSRIKFDLDIPTWEKLTGQEAVQLSLVGTSPVHLLKDLAEDTAFRGKLVVDVTEVLFYSQIPPAHKSALEAVAHYRKQTPSERFSSQVNLALESQFAFLEERRFGLHALLNEVPVPNRAGVFAFPLFPKSFEWNTRDRQTYMPELFLKDTQAVRQQTDAWAMLFMGDKSPAISGAALDNLHNEIAGYVNKIRSRGGKVYFVRTPSSSPLVEFEEKKYPRSQYWETLLAKTASPGWHFRDDSVTAKLDCPEWSHLSVEGARVYTHRLVQQLRKAGWLPS